VIFVERPHHSVLSHKACAIKQGWQDFSCTPCLSFSHLQGWKVQKSFFLKPWLVTGVRVAYLDIWPKIVSNSKKIPETNCKLVVFSTFHWIDELQAIPTSVFFQKNLSFLWQNNWEFFGNFCSSSVNSCKLAIFLERFSNFFILKKLGKKNP